MNWSDHGNHLTSIDYTYVENKSTAMLSFIWSIIYDQSLLMPIPTTHSFLIDTTFPYSMYTITEPVATPNDERFFSEQETIIFG